MNFKFFARSPPSSHKKKIEMCWCRDIIGLDEQGMNKNMDFQESIFKLSLAKP